MPDHRGEYATVTARPWESMSLADKIALLQGACATLKIDGRIVDWEAHLHHRRSQTLLVNASGAHMAQRFDYVSPGLLAVANEGAQTQRRTGGGAGSGRQGGLEQLPLLGFPDTARRIAEEALALLDAPECPGGVTDLLLMPSQMVLQIHESISSRSVTPLGVNDTTARLASWPVRKAVTANVQVIVSRRLRGDPDFFSSRADQSKSEA